MAITRTPMVDDDGSGTTGTIINNAWKQELYGQIDAMATSGVWTPIDTSGAGLALSVTSARFWRLDKIVFVSLHVTYPVTANSSPAFIGGLPVGNGSGWGGLYPSQTPVPCSFAIPPSTTGFYVMNPSSGLARSNSELSGVTLILSGVYLTA
jgi:hypothetical protein